MCAASRKDGVESAEGQEKRGLLDATLGCVGCPCRPVGPLPLPFIVVFHYTKKKEGKAITLMRKNKKKEEKDAHNLKKKTKENTHTPKYQRNIRDADNKLLYTTQPIHRTPPPPTIPLPSVTYHDRATTFATLSVESAEVKKRTKQTKVSTTHSHPTRSPAGGATHTCLHREEAKRKLSFPPSHSLPTLHCSNDWSRPRSCVRHLPTPHKTTGAPRCG